MTSLGEIAVEAAPGGLLGALEEPLALGDMVGVLGLPLVEVLGDPDTAGVCCLSFHHLPLVGLCLGVGELALAKVGLDRTRLDDDVVGYIADLAGGNARDGIALLRRAARLARTEGCDITLDLVDDVRADARADVRKRRVRSLGTHQRTLYEIVREAGEIQAGALHTEYERRVQDPRTKRRRRHYLDALERYDLIEQDGQGRAVTYRLGE